MMHQGIICHGYASRRMYMQWRCLENGMISEQWKVMRRFDKCIVLKWEEYNYVSENC